MPFNCKIKGTRCFLNLEKRQYANRLIPRLALEDVTEITDQKDIIRERERFYEKRKKRTLRKVTFLLNNVLDALKAIGDGKSPGMDGFTVKFYSGASAREARQRSTMGKKNW